MRFKLFIKICSGHWSRIN